VLCALLGTAIAAGPVALAPTSDVTVELHATAERTQRLSDTPVV
jgi:hypothetical protein